MLLLNRLVRCASNLAVPPVRSTYAKGGLAGWRLRKALELLESSSRGQPSLPEIAQSIGLHPTSFCRAFRQSTGLSPHRYLLVYRVNRAKDMMKDHALTLTQIALDCGFSSSSQFSSVFSRIVGFPPRTYRRSM
jgi:transcriptional regulator GlxA family with amidase domain